MLTDKEKKDILYNFDWSIDKYEDRLEFVKEKKEKYMYDNKYGLSNRFKDTLSQIASTYLLKSKDCLSFRKIDYSFYIDNRDFNKEYVNKKKDANRNVDSDYPINDDYIFKSELHPISYESSTSEDYNNILDKLSQNDFNEYNYAISFDLNERNVLKNMKIKDIFLIRDIINSVNNVQLHIVANEILEVCMSRLNNAIDDETDAMIVSLIDDGLSVSEIARKLKIPRTTVSSRISKIENNVFY